MPPTYPAGFLPWVGEFITVTAPGEWSWRKCVGCGKDLDREGPRSRGWGDDCQRSHGVERLEKRREVALKMDRERMRQDLSWARSHG